MVLKTLISLLISSNLYAANVSEYLPANLLQLDQYFTHHVIIVEKSTHKLYLYKNDKSSPVLVDTLQVATGKKAGNKLFQGDHKTPEGIYHFTEFLDHDKLIKRHGDEGEIYGVGAFVLNYPNPLDRRKGKTGGGIWLHSTNDETRIDKGLDSRGCIVAHNSKLIDLSNFLELNKTAIIITHEMKYLKKSTWLQKRKEINFFIESWLSSWQNESLKDYISHYHNREFFSSTLNSITALKNYKRAVFASAGRPSVKLENISITVSKDYAVVNFGQIYESSTIKDIGKKTLYLKRDEHYNWKIVTESWSKNGIDNLYQTAFFEPSMRFFKSTQPKHVMGHELGQKHSKRN